MRNTRFWTGSRPGFGQEADQEKAFIGVSWRTTRQSRLNSLGLASLNNFSELQRIGADPTCLIPVPRLIGIGESWPRA